MGFWKLKKKKKKEILKPLLEKKRLLTKIVKRHTQEAEMKCDDCELLIDCMTKPRPLPVPDQQRSANRNAAVLRSSL